MNWVGGSRNRLVMKNDAKRQREFFEKRKMQQRLKNLGFAPPASPQGASSGSVDLMTLFIVNQIAAKKETEDPPKVAVLGSCRGGSKHKRNEPLVLPMSPCSPSQLTLVESQPQYSVQGTKKRKNAISQGFRCRQLSPVQESAFSDNSASDYLPPITDPLSPFSSTSSASSGQVNLGQIKLVSPGMFPLKLNLQQRSQMQAQLPPRCSPPPWDTSGLEQTKFQPFSQPRGMTDCIPWSCGSNPPLYQLGTPKGAKVLFASPEQHNIETRDHARHEVTFSLSQPEDREPMLDFTLNQSETEQQNEEDVFRGFSTEECEREVSHLGRGKLKIHLRDETQTKPSTPQTVPESQCMGGELSNCTDFSCLEHNNGFMTGCDCSPSYCCCRGYLSSDSNDEEECCQPSLQAVSSYMDQGCCADSPNPDLGLQGNPEQRPTQPRLLTPLLKPQMNIRDDQKVVENVAHPDKAIGSNSQQMGSHTDQFDSPQASAKTQSPELCKCKTTLSETRDAGTQTANNPKAQTCDASTQCSFVVDDAAKATGLHLCPPPVDVSIQHVATGRQTDTAAELKKLTPSPSKTRSGGEDMPWSMKKTRSAFLSGSTVINKLTANKTDGKIIPQRPINPCLDALRMTDGKEGQVERGQQENGCLMRDLSNKVSEEVTSAARVSRHSEEAGTLDDVANILLLLKQRKKEG